MDIMIWLLAGAVAGWVGYAYMGLNGARGLVVSMIIGMMGGVLGGKVIAPVFGAVAQNASDFSFFAVAFALTSAVGCLVIGNLISDRYGI